MPFKNDRLHTGSEANSKIAQAVAKSEPSPVRKLAALSLSQNVNLNFILLHIISLHAVNILLYFCPI